MTNLDPLFNSNRDDTAIARKGLARWFFRAMGIIFLAELTGLLNFVFYYSTTPPLANCSTTSLRTGPFRAAFSRWSRWSWVGSC